MNRITRLWPASSPVEPSFVVCALPMFVPASLVAQVAEVYRLAAERTREQLAPRRPAGVPAFSCN